MNNSITSWIVALSFVVIAASSYMMLGKVNDLTTALDYELNNLVNK